MAGSHAKTWFFVCLAAVLFPVTGEAGTDLRIICQPCEVAEDCGDHTDICLIYRNDAGDVIRSACGMHCLGQEDCFGLECRTIPDRPGLNQCVDQLHRCSVFPVFECTAAGHCAEGHDCVEGYCVEVVLGLGEECERDEECESELCLNTYLGQVCTQNCDWTQPLDSCPAGFFCTERDRCGDGICVPGDAGEGALDSECVQDTDCLTAFCSRRPSGSGAICTEPCTLEAPECPADHHCEDRDVGCGTCVPDCHVHSDCPDELGCVFGSCRELQAEGELCASNEECASGVCESGTCEGSGDAGVEDPDTGPETGSTFATDCDCATAGRTAVRGFPLPLLLFLLPSLGLLKRRSTK